MAEQPNPRFRGKVAVVTGAGTGIGLAIAERLAAEGAQVAIAEINLGAAERAAAAIRAAGGLAEPVPVDVSDEAQVARMTAAVEARFGGIDILVNNAGVVLHKLVLDTPLPDWERQLAVQLTGPFLACKHVAKGMVARGRGGRIVNISSLSAEMGRVRGAAHCASKAGLVMLTKVLAMELAPHGITVNAVAPGLIEVPSQRDEQNISAAYRDSYIRMIPLGRLGEMEEVASLVAYLASEEARWITGQQMRVDGGTMAGHYALGEQHDHAALDGRG
ncbi:3-oxoacyl-ACP reductase FabG [Roseomonas sp. OT10]|uniref:SDR family NAD(P)-dependent oxidoreductase n=1 Tax=Roseomonas cutis TaxID=2897332 RepID=UPI001E5F2454|nr:3-oxoacyl-ACP reductase family protein [Roseomonas sp. OT10]UFN47227.1 3-oxoacyl-ACP reductase FabG [Roseomonas sp. OT10]